jgi:HK97 gp10 family phage protein
MLALADIVSSVGISSELQSQLGGTHLAGGNTVTVKVQGLAELEAALNQLPEKVAKKSMLDSMKAATKVFQERAIQLAPYDRAKTAGMHLVDGIRMETRSGSHGVKGSWVHGKVGLHPDVFYGRFIEFGWITARGGASIPAQPFMRPAFDGQKFRAIAVISQGLEAGIQAAAKELHR